MSHIFQPPPPPNPTPNPPRIGAPHQGKVLYTSQLLTSHNFGVVVHGGVCHSKCH